MVLSDNAKRYAKELHSKKIDPEVERGIRKAIEGKPQKRQVISWIETELISNEDATEQERKTLNPMILPNGTSYFVKTRMSGKELDGPTMNAYVEMMRESQENELKRNIRLRIKVTQYNKGNSRYELTRSGDI